MLKKDLKKKLFIGTLLFIAIFMMGSAETMAQTSSLAGEWNAAMNTPGGVRNYQIVFVVDGEKLSGTVKRAAGDVPLTGTIKGKDVEFSYTVRYNDNDLTLTINGKLEGDEIKGTVAFGESGQSDGWSAKRAVAPKSIAQ